MMPTNHIEGESEAEKRKAYFAKQYRQYQEFIKNKANNQHTSLQGDNKPQNLVIGKAAGTSDQQGSIFTRDLYKNAEVKNSVDPAILKNIIKSQAGSSVDDAQVNDK